MRLKRVGIAIIFAMVYLPNEERWPAAVWYKDSLFGLEKHIQISRKKGGVFEKLHFDKKLFFRFFPFISKTI